MSSTEKEDGKMEDGNSSFSMMHRPSLLERIWRWFGYRSVRVDLPDGIGEKYPGWMMTETRMNFSVADRIRLLISGRLQLTLRQATSQQVDEGVSAMSHRILYPSEDW